LGAKIEGGKIKGRRRKLWIDEVRLDMRSLVIKNWKAVARDRREWKAVLKEAKVHFGL
jgi:hypothetical protein